MHHHEALSDPSRGLVTETRPLQIKLATYLYSRMANGLPSMSEAGTGIGKSFAYLLNAIELAKDQKVVVTTGMKALQAQLFFKDLPYLVSKGYQVKYARKLGKANHGCKRQVMLHVVDPRELAVYQEFFDTVEHWVWEDAPPKLREKLPRNKSDYSVQYCNKQRCDFYGECEKKGYVASADACEEAKLIITNHALVGADLRILRQHDKTVLGDYGALIVDEAHKFPDAIRNALSYDMPRRFFEKMEERYRVLHGDLRADFNAMMQVPISDQKRLVAPPSINHARLEAQYRAMFTETSRTGAFGVEAFAFATLCRETVKAYCAELRCTPEQLRNFCNERTKMSWDNDEQDLREMWGSIPRSFRKSEGAMQLLYFLDMYLDKLLSFATAIDLATKEKLRYVVAVENSEGRQPTIRTLPVNVDSELKDYYARGVTPHYLSATLMVGGRFDYFASEVGYDVHQPNATFAAGTPFDYGKQAWLYIPKHLPEPSAGEAYLEAVINECDVLLRANHGHAFVLFTSFRDMNAVAQGLKARRYPYPLLTQSDELKARGRELFLSTPNATLLGTRSFWEGIDIPGLHLSLVIIPKAPFPIATEPLVKAKCALAGDSWFGQVHMPMMLTDLRQMSGRLIRSTEDVGVVALLDARVHTKGYGNRLRDGVGFPRWGSEQDRAVRILGRVTELREQRTGEKRWWT